MVQLVANTPEMSDIRNSLLLKTLYLNHLFSFLFLPLLVGKSIEISSEYACFKVAIACE